MSHFFNRGRSVSLTKK